MAGKKYNLNLELRVISKQAQRDLGSFGKMVKDLGRSLTSLGKTLSLTVTAPMVLAGRAAFNAARDFDRLNKMVLAMEGSADAGGEAMDKLQRLSFLPGIKFEQATTGYANLRALGFSLDETTTILGTFSNALALFGGTAEDFARVTRAITQIVGKGNVQAEEINQLAESFPQIRKFLEEAYGTSEGRRINDILQEQGNGVRNFVRTVSNELSKLEAAPLNLDAAFVTLQDTFNVVLGDMVSSVLGAKDLNEVFIKLANDLLDLRDNFKELSPEVIETGLKFAGLLAAAGPVLIIFGQLTTVIGMLLSPIGLITAGLVGLYTYVNRPQEGETWLDFMVNMLADAELMIRQLIAAMDIAVQYVSKNAKTFGDRFSEIQGPWWLKASGAGFQVFDDLLSGKTNEGGTTWKNHPLLQGFGDDIDTNRANTWIKNTAKDLGEFSSAFEVFGGSVEDVTEMYKRLREEFLKPLGLDPDDPALTINRGGNVAGQGTEADRIRKIKSERKSEMDQLESYLTIMESWLEQKNKQKVAMEDYLAMAEEVAQAEQDYFDQFKERVAEQTQLNQEAREEPAWLTNFREAGDLITNTLTTAFQDFFQVLFDGGSNAFDAFIQGLKKLLVQLIATTAAAAALSVILGPLTAAFGIGGGLSSGIQGIFGIGGEGSGFLKILSALTGFKLFAQGGVVRRPTMGILGEAGPEAVIPLDRLSEMQGRGPVEVYGELRLDGMDLRAAIQRVENKNGLLY